MGKFKLIIFALFRVLAIIFLISAIAVYSKIIFSIIIFACSIIFGLYIKKIEIKNNIINIVSDILIIVFLLFLNIKIFISIFYSDIFEKLSELSLFWKCNTLLLLKNIRKIPYFSEIS